MTQRISSRQTYTSFTGRLSDTNGLSLGHKGAKVTEMQKMLKAAGFDPGPLDGKFGPRTLKAVDGTMGLGEFKRLKGNYEKITGDGFNERT